MTCSIKGQLFVDDTTPRSRIGTHQQMGKKTIIKTLPEHKGLVSNTEILYRFAVDELERTLLPKNIMSSIRRNKIFKVTLFTRTLKYAEKFLFRM